MDSAIYTVVSNANVAADGTIPVGTVVRRVGCDMGVEGDAIACRGIGYYAVDVTATLSPDAAGAVGISLMQDGVQVPGATAMGTGATGQPMALSISAIVRKVQCGTTTLSLALDSDGTAIGALVENCTRRVIEI